MKQFCENTILIVDDSPANIDLLAKSLCDLYDIVIAKDGESALKIIFANPPDLVLLDVEMPGLKGYDVCRIIRADKRTAHVPIIFVTALSTAQDELNALELGAVDFVSKPFNVEIVKIRVKNQLELKMYRDNLEALVRERTEKLELTQAVTIDLMGVLVDYRDKQTGEHILRTKQYVQILADQLKTHPRFASYLDDDAIQMLCLSAPLHDIGKVGIRDSILLNPGKLSVEEFDEMKKHTVYGREILEASEKKLSASSFLRVAKDIAGSHHERWDGTGYPDGIKGELIPVSGRIMALADVYDALISERPYKKAFSHEKALQIINESSGTHFDPAVVESFMALEKKFQEISGAQ